VDFIESLSSARWRRSKRTEDGIPGVLVTLHWTTKSGDVCDVMGFGPSVLMPVTRRSPYFAIGLWAGGRANPFRGKGITPQSRPGHVNFLDAPPQFEDQQSYENLFRETRTSVGELMASAGVRAKPYYSTTFALAPEIASRL